MQQTEHKRSSRLSPAGQVFKPRAALGGAHRQTLVSHFLPRQNVLPQSEHRLFRVAPDVQVLCRCNWQPQRRSALTLVLVHGLEGSSEAHYMVGTAGKAWYAGLNVVRMNVRSCGGTEAFCPTLYHSGMSSDVGEVVRALISEDSLESIALAGFSMGGNQVLKLAGEWGRDGSAPPQLRAVAAVSPAADLAASASALHEPANRLYEWWFLWSLRQTLRRKVRLYPTRYQVTRWWWRSVVDFDDCITAPHNDFLDAADYYHQASAAQVLDHISVPTLIIHSKDDPMVRITAETRARIAANRCIQLLETEHGGHCGFLAPARGYDGRWAERRIVEFVQGLN
jgi:predicted alpha/beta-fold hydrolase